MISSGRNIGHKAADSAASETGDVGRAIRRSHLVIQAAFGWADAHVHQFSLDGDTALPEAQVRLDETIQEAGDSLRYLYDDTDNWDHQIKVEKILDTTVPADAPDAAVTGGRRATPPENCGGLLTEAELAEVLDDPAHFDIAEADARLR